jgi:hypothetical protein
MLFGPAAARPQLTPATQSPTKIDAVSQRVEPATVIEIPKGGRLKNLAVS